MENVAVQKIIIIESRKCVHLTNLAANVLLKMFKVCHFKNGIFHATWVQCPGSTFRVGKPQVTKSCKSNYLEERLRGEHRATLLPTTYFLFPLGRKSRRRFLYSTHGKTFGQSCKQITIVIYDSRGVQLTVKFLILWI